MSSQKLRLRRKQKGLLTVRDLSSNLREKENSIEIHVDSTKNKPGKSRRCSSCKSDKTYMRRGIHPHWLRADDGSDLCQSCWAKLHYIPKPRKQPVTLKEKREREKLWRSVNPERCKASTRKHKQRLNQLWGSPGTLNSSCEQVASSEMYVADKILPNLGFTNILLTRNHLPRFFCDLLTRDSQDRECGFDVKLSHNTYIKKKKIELIRSLGIRFFIVFLKPDYTFWCMRELVKWKRYYSAVVEFKARNAG